MKMVKKFGAVKILLQSMLAHDLDTHHDAKV